MLFLLPPSETKAPGGIPASGAALELSFPKLDEARAAVQLAVLQLGADPPLAAKALKLGAKQLGLLHQNLELATSERLPALTRYTGTLYDAIHGGRTGADAPLSKAAWARAAESVLIQSPLFGLISATDAIPAYRLSASTALPGLRLREVWSKAHGQVFEDLSGPVIDLRSKAYAELAPLPRHLDSFWVEVVTRESDGSLRALNHFNKRAKGLLLRAALEASSNPLEISDLAEIATEAGLELYQNGHRGLTLVTDQIGKYQASSE